MTAYEQMVADFATRVAALEQREAELEGARQAHRIELTALREQVLAIQTCRAEDVMPGGVLYNHGTQLGNLQDQLEEDRTEFQGRLEALEPGESDRWEWLRTYNAAVPEAMRQLEGAFTGERYARAVHEYCVAISNAAHGPLETAKERKLGKALKESVEWQRETRANVNALVKAALRIRAEYAESLPVSLGAAAEMELALGPFKPFEVAS